MYEDSESTDQRLESLDKDHELSSVTTQNQKLIAGVPELSPLMVVLPAQTILQQLLLTQQHKPDTINKAIVYSLYTMNEALCLLAM